MASLLGFPVLRIELVEFVVVDIERSDIPSGLDDPRTAFLYGVVEQAAAYKVYQSVRRDSGPVFRKKVRMFLDERNDVV